MCRGKRCGNGFGSLGRSRRFQITVVVAVAIVVVMKVAVDQVIRMVSMWRQFMTAAGTVFVPAIMAVTVVPRCARCRVGL